MADAKIQAAAQRLARNSDFEAVFDHLLLMQGDVVLNMDALSPNLAHAKIYYDALRDVKGLIGAIAEERDNG